MTTQLRMTTQLGITPATAPSAMATRKATKDPADQVADQFAAMFASLCFASLPQPQPTPAAKPQEAAPADGIANPEIAGSDSIAAPPTPVITLQTLAPGTGKEAPETAAKGASLPLGPPATLFSSEQTFKGLPVRATQTEITPAPANVEPAPAPVWLPQIPTPSSPRQESAWPSASAQRSETIPPVPVMILPPPVIRPAGNTGLVDPTQPAAEAALPTFISRSAVEAPVAQNPEVVANNSLAEQTLPIEAARRDANLVASYLAKTTGNDPEGNAAAGVKTLPAGSGFDLRGDDRERNSDFDSRLQFLAPAGEASFAATVRDLQSNGSVSSIQSQTISQIIAQAETLPGRQMRSLRLRLRPEELGQIDIQLSRDATGRISAHISAERESARGALSRSLDQLRETLSRAGLTVDKLEISAQPGLFAGNRESDNARSNTRESPSVVANLLTENETEAGGQPRAEDEKLLSLHA